MKRHRFLPLIACVCVAAAQASEPQGETAARAKPLGAEIQVFVENDKWSSTDRYYTNGLKIGFGVAARNIPGEGPVRDALDAFGDAINCDRVRSLNGGLFLGQNMYTPRDTDVTTAQPFDRPWAAWLYVGAVLQVFRTCGGNRSALDTVELDIGVVGPAALGEETQNVWHRIINVPEAKGWENQLPNEAAFLLSYLHKERIGGKYFEVIPHVGAAVGTVMTFVRTGALIRAGHNMTGFGPDRIEPGGAMLQNYRTSKRCETWWPCEAYVYAGIDARAVAYNIFLDGTVFRDSPSVDRKHLVYDLSFGASARLGFVRVTVGRVTRSEEFTSRLRGGGRQTFHSVNLGFEF